MSAADAVDPRPLASLSLDLDNLWSYQKTHGDPGWEALGSYLDVAVPRLLELCAERGLTITVFVVGQDAALERNAEALAALGEAGHEVGNHSFRHEPWLHRYSRAETDDELGRAEEAIVAATGRRPVGFRGPGYSLSATTLEVLAERGYRYDASVLPTWIGPLARAYYFRSAELTPEQREERAGLFGHLADGRRPLKPHRWALDGGADLLELPVTTVPLVRVPMHPSYLLYLAGVRPSLATGYFAAALRLCAARRVEPSILLHPLDLLGADDVDALGFFPAMGRPGAEKRALVGRFLDQLAERRRVVTMAEHVEAIEARGGLRSVVPHLAPGRRTPADADGRGAPASPGPGSSGGGAP